MAAASMGTEEKPSGCPVKHSVSIIVFVQKAIVVFILQSSKRPSECPANAGKDTLDPSNMVWLT